MTEEEINERNSLINSINNAQRRLNAAIAEYNRLVAEYNITFENVGHAINIVSDVDSFSQPHAKHANSDLSTEYGYTTEVHQLLDEIVESYTLLKNVSSASKYLTQYKEKYNTLYADYNNLRRVSLGYVVGVDANIWRSDVPRKTVEKAYLANTDYWLAYAIMAVVLWANNKPEDCARALRKSLDMNPKNTELFFLMINLRFNRTDSARRWFSLYTEKIDPLAIDPNLEYFLQAYLSGAFGSNELFKSRTDELLQSLSDRTKRALPTAIDDATNMICDRYSLFRRSTEKDYIQLRRACTEYHDMRLLLGDAEMFYHLSDYINNTFVEKDAAKSSLNRHIEDALYALINAYDPDELELLNLVRYNELVVGSRGDRETANKLYTKIIDDQNEVDNFLVFMSNLAFSTDREVDLAVRKYGLNQCKDEAIRATEKLNEQYLSRQKKTYPFEIDGWKHECSPENIEECKTSLTKHYKKELIKSIFNDKTFKFGSLIALLGIFVTVIGFVLPQIIVGVIGIVVAVVAIAIVVYQILKLKKRSEFYRDKGLKLLSEALEQMTQWRNDFAAALEERKQTVQAIEKVLEK